MEIAEDKLRIDHYDINEWWDAARRVNQKLSREQFERDWAEFEKLKQRKGKQ